MISVSVLDFVGLDRFDRGGKGWRGTFEDGVDGCEVGSDGEGNHCEGEGEEFDYHGAGLFLRE